MDVSAEFIQALPTAQKRTSGFKKFVHVTDDLVYKGPYSQSDKSLKCVIRFTEAMRLLEDHLGLDTTFLPYQSIVSVDDVSYVVFENVGRKLTDKDVETVSTKIDKKIAVVKRETFVYRVSEVEKTDGVTLETRRKSLQHLYLRYILNIGDSGTHNVLIAEDGRVLGIDLEEERKDYVPKDPLEALFKRPSKLQRKLYGDDIDGICRFVGEKALNSNILQLLEKLEIKGCKERADHFEKIVAEAKGA